MKRNNKSSKPGNRNIRNPKSKPKRLNEQCQNGFEITIQNNKEQQKLDIVTISSSPRPTTLSSRWTKPSDVEYKCCSGSECEDFQTPSLEYDIRNDSLVDDYFSNGNTDFDKEWDDIGFFDNIRLDDHVPNECEKTSEIKITVKNNKIDGDLLYNCHEHIDNEMKNNQFSIEENALEPMEDYHVEDHFGMVVNVCSNMEADESVDENIIESNMGYDTSENINKDSSRNLCWDKKDDIMMNLTNNEEIILEKHYEQESSDEEIFNSICTEENLEDEIMSVKYFTLELANENYFQKSITLPTKSMQDSYIKSNTSMTNVTSISENSSMIHIYQENKPTKKAQTNPFSKCKQFLKHIKKGNKSEKKQSANETSNTNLPKTSVQRCETELQVFPGAINLKGNSVKEKEPKTNFLKRFFKRKLRRKKEIKQKGDDSVIPEVKINPLLQKSEIEKKVIDDFNRTLNSLIRLEDTQRCVEPVKTKQIDNNKKIVDEVDAAIVRPFSDEPDDHLYPDAFTNSKLVTYACLSIPFIDDPIVSQIDLISFFNGESRKISINPMFSAPMASMESLCLSDVPFMDDSFTNKTDSIIFYNGENKNLIINATFTVPLATTESFYASAESMKSENFQNQ